MCVKTDCIHCTLIPSNIIYSRQQYENVEHKINDSRIIDRYVGYFPKINIYMKFCSTIFIFDVIQKEIMIF